MNKIDSAKGFTLIEVTIILLVLVILSSIMLPQLGNYNRLARYVKVKEDLGAICAGMKKMLDEVMMSAYYGKPGRREQPIGLLVGPGVPPVVGDDETYDWGREVGDDFVQITDVRRRPMTFLVDAFDQHLQENNPLDKGNPQPWDRYKNPIDNPERWAAGAFFGWRGPYFDEFTADPWGTRYGSNVFALHRPTSGRNGYRDASDDGDFEERGGGWWGNSRRKTDGFSSAVVCISAGPDQRISTIFNQPMNDADGDDFYGWFTAGDDIAVVLSAGGPF